MAKKFDRFTERARNVLRLAQIEAQGLGHNYLGTEHLLLGLLAEREGLAARILTELGVEQDKLRSAVETIVGRGTGQVHGEMGLTPRAKKVIELAVDEAQRLRHDYVGTEHLLLGIMREGEGVACGVLESQGVSLTRVRDQTLQALGSPQSASQTPRLWQAIGPAVIIGAGLILFVLVLRRVLVAR